MYPNQRNAMIQYLLPLLYPNKYQLRGLWVKKSLRLDCNKDLLHLNQVLGLKVKWDSLKVWGDLKIYLEKQLKTINWLKKLFSHLQRSQFKDNNLELVAQNHNLNL